MIWWNGYSQPSASLEEVLDMAAGYCDTHSLPEQSLERCKCEDHIITDDTHGAWFIRLPRFQHGQPILNEDGEEIGTYHPVPKDETEKLATQ